MFPISSRIDQINKPLMVLRKAKQIDDLRPYGGGMGWVFDLPDGQTLSVINHGNGTAGLPFEMALIDSNDDFVMMEGWQTSADIAEYLERVCNG